MAPAIQRPARLAMISTMRSRMRLADQRVELAREVGPAPFARAGLHVEIEKRVPDLFGEIAAGQPVHGDAVRQRVVALAADGLALACGERGKKIVETGEAAIVPVKLLIGPLQITEFAEQTKFRLRARR